MKRLITVSMITSLLTACAEFPTHQMAPDEAMILTKPIVYSQGHQRITIQFESAGEVRRTGLKTAMYINANIPPHKVSIECKVGKSRYPIAVNGSIEPNSCYTPTFTKIASTKEKWHEILVRQALGEYSKDYHTSYCAIDLKEVDCNWLRKEAKSISDGFIENPAFIK